MFRCERGVEMNEGEQFYLGKAMQAYKCRLLWNFFRLFSNYINRV